MKSEVGYFLFFQALIFLFVLGGILVLHEKFLGTFLVDWLILVVCGLALYLYLNLLLLKYFLRHIKTIQESLKMTIHEINIPISTILLNTQLLQKNETVPKNLQRLERIKTASQNLKELYDELEYSIKKEVGRVEKQSFNLKVLIDESCEKFSELKNSIKIECDIDEKITLHVDKKGFQKCVDNLLSNAIKYNRPDGFIKIELQGSILSFENSGKSINVENLQNIFDKYFQEDNHSQGFGVGLHVVKDFCDGALVPIYIKPMVGGTKIELDLRSILGDI